MEINTEGILIKPMVNEIKIKRLIENLEEEILTLGIEEIQDTTEKFFYLIKRHITKYYLSETVNYTNRKEQDMNDKSKLLNMDKKETADFIYDVYETLNKLETHMNSFSDNGSIGEAKKNFDEVKVLIGFSLTEHMIQKTNKTKPEDQEAV